MLNIFGTMFGYCVFFFVSTSKTFKSPNTNDLWLVLFLLFCVQRFNGDHKIQCSTTFSRMPIQITDTNALSSIFTVSFRTFAKLLAAH